MDWLIKEARIIDPHSEFHLQTRDIEIKSGVITAIGNDLSSEGARALDLQGAHVSPGWVDLGAEVGDPGFEHREDLQSLSHAAAAGGFTAVAVWPNTDPPIHDKASVSYLIQRGKMGLVDILPIGAISRNRKGTDITEMIDMHTAGARAFSDGDHPVQHAGLMLRALLYVKTFGGVVINQPLDHSIAGSGHIHEGGVSTSLGLPGIPALAEELMVERDIRLAEYADSRLHLAHISTAGSVQKVRDAKARSIKVTASVAALNLLLNVNALSSFDTLCKVMPPLRSESDRKALLDGLADGTIDCISSHHVPREEEAKLLEFPYADFGALGLTTAYATAQTAIGDTMGETALVAALTYSPRAILGLEPVTIGVGAAANLTCFDPNQSWTPDRNGLPSKSRNNPLLGQALTGRVVGVIKGTKIWWKPSE